MKCFSFDKRGELKAPKISLITATFNVAESLPLLVSDVESQDSSDFEWIVADGGSYDGTCEILMGVMGVSLCVDSRRDCGIYDAFNRAISMARGEYYLIVGGDDRLNHWAISSYISAITVSGSPDIVLGAVKIGGVVRQAIWRPKRFWRGAFNVLSSHSLGLLVRSEFHRKCGPYSLEFRQCSDSLYISKIIGSNPRVALCPKVIGEFVLGGVSNTNVIRGLAEGFHIQLRAGSNKVLQFLMYIMRLIKNYHRISA